MPADKAEPGIVNTGETQRNAQPEQSAEPPVTQATPEPAETRPWDGVMASLGLSEEIQEQVRELNQLPAEDEVVEEPPAEETEEAQADTEPEEGEPESEEEEPEPAAKEQWPAEAIKLKDKYRRQRNEARDEAANLKEQLAQATSQLESAQPVTVAPTYSDPLAHVTDQVGLKKARDEAKILRDFCRERRSGYTAFEGQEQERFIPPEEVAKAESYAEDVLNEFIPAKQKQLEIAPQFTSQAKQLLPTMFERGTIDYQAAEVVRKNSPHLVNDPQRDLRIAIELIGWKTILEQQQKAQAGTNGDKKLQVPDELKQQHQMRGKVPILRQNPPSRVNGNSAPSTGKAKHQAMQDVLTDSSSANLGRAMRLAREGTESKDPRRAVSV